MEFYHIGNIKITHYINTDCYAASVSNPKDAGEVEHREKFPKGYTFQMVKSWCKLYINLSRIFNEDYAEVEECTD